jgi:hypothetical protein
MKVSRKHREAKFFLLISLFFFATQWTFCAAVWAKTVTPQTARHLVNGWLAGQASPMVSLLGSEVEDVATFTDSNSQPAYYAVNLRPRGFVIVPADDLVEPIVCFSPEGSFTSSGHDPLYALVSRDIPARVNLARSAQATQLAAGSAQMQAAVRNSGEKAQSKWNRILSESSYLVSATHKSGVSDVRVSPLLTSKWGQTIDIDGNDALYNYYTPGFSVGDWRNYPCGCVATAMAQYMRFWQFPVDGVGTASFPITFNGNATTRHLRGGNGGGGPYNWNLMPLVPGRNTTDAQRKAIGSLTYDAGVSAKMDYESYASGANMSDAAIALVYTFGYYNAICGYNDYYDIGTNIIAMVNPNLDSGNPVILGIDGSDGGHAVVADGYGYQQTTMYHHLNMGWYGRNDLWYNLPNIDAPLSSFDVVDSVIYNIYISGTGEIISGRVIAADSKTPLVGAAVTAVRDGGSTYQTTTNSKGIYAFTQVPPYSTYTVSAARPGYAFMEQVATTGSSLDYEAVSGNCWAVDFLAAIGISKLTVTAGKNNSDSIAFSGTLNVSADDITAAEDIQIDVDSQYRAESFVQTFPVDVNTFKNGKFSCTINIKPVKVSFALDTKTCKFSFAAKGVDLSGLSCPLTVRMVIGDYSVESEVNEAVVNAKKPIPIDLLMGIANSLRIDKSKFTRDRSTDNITSIAVSGGFSVEDVNDSNMADNDFTVGLAGQTFTIPAGSFKNNKGKFSCLKITLSGSEIAAATFDFNKCTWTLTIKNTNFVAASGSTELDIDFASFSGSDEVSLP